MHEDISIITVVEGQDRVGDYYRLKEFTQGYEDLEDLPKEVIASDTVENLRENNPFLKCSTCGDKIGITTKIYFEPDNLGDYKIENISALEDKECYCKKHFEQQQVIDEL